MDYLLEVRNITKRFGGLVAVDDVSVGLNAGEVLGIVGDNGAGKSTLIKVISGVHRPDEGKIFIMGRETRIDTPMEARKLGIETIYQDLALAENLNVYSNIFLGREKLKRYLGVLKVLDHDLMQKEARRVLKGLEIEIPSLRNIIRVLSGGQRQAVAISRSIYWDARVLIMDEPTAGLAVAEQNKVLKLVDRLRGQGIGVIIITHQLHDVFAVSDRLVVMRRGQKVGERLTKETNTDEIVRLIIGAESVDQG
jgi:ABC-type sugar transport system ATPase subunit